MFKAVSANWNLSVSLTVWTSTFLSHHRSEAWTEQGVQCRILYKWEPWHKQLLRVCNFYQVLQQLPHKAERKTTSCPRRRRVLQHMLHNVWFQQTSVCETISGFYRVQKLTAKLHKLQKSIFFALQCSSVSCQYFTCFIIYESYLSVFFCISFYIWNPQSMRCAPHQSKLSLNICVAVYCFAVQRKYLLHLCVKVCAQW